MIFILAILLFFTSNTAEAIVSMPHPNTNQPPNIGNFALPVSQEPGPFFSFGQNIVDKNNVQLFFEPSYLRATQEHFTEFDSYLLYGVSDNASVLLTFPVAVNYRNGAAQSSGSADASIQGEYAIYGKSNSSYSDQATIVTALSLPTGSTTKSPATGYGSPSFFIGATYNRTFVDWLLFASPGALITTSHDSLRYGSQYLYQAGIGRSISSIPNKYIFFGLLEFNGEYIEKTKLLGHYEPNSGGNIIFITPSVWLSTKKVIFQFGVSFPVIQQWNGNQSANNYYLTGSFSWTIN